MKNQDDHDWDKDPKLALSLTRTATEAVNPTKKGSLGASRGVAPKMM
jgi:hypothetical protein